MNLTTVLTWIIIGGIAGILADALIKGIRLGMLGKIFIGIAGGFLGGWIFQQLNITLVSGMLGSIIAAFVGAVILLLVLRLLR